MVNVRSLESVLFSIGFVMYYVYVTSGPSLLLESTDSMINIYKSRSDISYKPRISK